MGSCFSSQADSVILSAAKVISLNGTLREFPVPVTVSQVLQFEASSCFLCNSDKLYFDQPIPALNFDDHLQVGQIYFVLPMSKLQYTVTASDMAALAVKASLALVKGSKGKDRRNKFRISPLLDVIESVGDGDDGFRKFDPNVAPTITRSGSVRKLRRSASRKAKLAIASFRMRLTTIYEGTVAE
ncbi:uncharacterized protein [Aristolochia californica]|uniref:uncharacterized protein n=1 Tax=Aristolochia californica TaxID=171875 RepID=UPI0035D8520E